MKRLVLTFSDWQADQIRAIDPDVRIEVGKQVMPLHYPAAFAFAMEQFGADHILFLGPECSVPRSVYYKLGFKQLRNGYHLVVPLKEHPGKPVFYPGMMFAQQSDKVLQFLQDWQEGNKERYPWQAMEEALYACPLPVYYTPSTWWRTRRFMGIGVVIPCFNHEDLLPEAVDSALRAGAKQIIVVDDGSEGDIVGALKQYAGQQVYLLRQENKGLPAARNAGIRACTMEAVINLDADDWMHQDHILNAEEALEQNVWVYTNVQLVGDAQRHIKTKVNEVTMRALQPFHPATLYHKDAWQFVGGYDETIEGFESWDFHARLIQAGWHPKKGKGLIYYRKRKGKGMLAQRVLRDKTTYLRGLVDRSPVYFEGAFKDEIGTN